MTTLSQGDVLLTADEWAAVEQLVLALFEVGFKPEKVLKELADPAKARFTDVTVLGAMREYGDNYGTVPQALKDRVVEFYQEMGQDHGLTPDQITAVIGKD